MARLVVGRVAEADGEAAHRPLRLRLHQRHHGRGIGAAGEERAERDVGDHAAADGVAQDRIEAVDRLRGGARRGRARDHVGNAPIGRDHWLAARAARSGSSPPAA